MSSKNIDPRIKKYKNIITINPYQDNYYEYKNQELKDYKKLVYSDKNFNISYIRNRDMIVASLDIGYSAEDEELDDLLYMKAYEELGLDEEKEYNIEYQKSSSDSSSNVYNLFIVEPNLIEEPLTEVVEEIKYIDLIIPAPLLYKTLYTNSVLEANNAHCYIYFTMNDTFVTIYNDGEFIYSKSIEFSLEQIYEKYCALIGEKIDEKKFFEVLESEGLKTTDSFFQQNLMKLFSEIFLQINDIIVYTKRAYNIERIEKLFLGSESGPIIGLGDYGYNYLGIPTFHLDFTFDIKNDEWYVDQLHYLMIKSGLDYLNNPSSSSNLTLYPRAPIFTKRASGQFILSTLFATCVAIGIPLIYLIPAYTTKAYNITLESDNTKLQKESEDYKGILAEKQSKIKKSKKVLDNLEAIFEGKAKTLTAIFSKKVNYKFKSGFLYKFSQDLSKFDLHVEDIISDEDSFTLSLLGSDEKKITKYIKYVSKKYFKDIKDINIHRIELSDDDFSYRGVLKVNYK